MKKMLDLVVVSNIRLNRNHCLIKLTTLDKSPIPDILPGQFVEVRVNNTDKAFLRRPISANYFDKSRNELWLLIQVVGKGTLQLSQLEKNGKVNLLIPLGNIFSIPQVFNANDKLLLVGGGVGIAPMLYLGSMLKEKGYNPVFLLGARSKDDLLQIEEFSKYGEVFCTTEDGSYGEKGYVTDHSILQNKIFSRIYSCGPKPMMVAVAKYAHKADIDCEVSLENTMACGFGACLCCVENTQKGNTCVCTEGPVFNTKVLKWID
ncbi:MAG: dihydroorotate dehydrogenase electron transfer subunit [Dysgonomonas sp.]